MKNWRLFSTVSDFIIWCSRPFSTLKMAIYLLGLKSESAFLKNWGESLSPQKMKTAENANVEPHKVILHQNPFFSSSMENDLLKRISFPPNIISAMTSFPAQKLKLETSFSTFPVSIVLWGQNIFGRQTCFHNNLGKMLTWSNRKSFPFGNHFHPNTRIDFHFKSLIRNPNLIRERRWQRKIHLCRQKP